MNDLSDSPAADITASMQAPQGPAARRDNATAPLVATIIAARPPATLTKRIDLDGDPPRLRKVPAAHLIDGRAKRVAWPTLHDLARALDRLPSNAALVCGVCPDHPDAPILSERAHRERGAPADAITRTRRHFQFARAPGLFLLDIDPPRDFASDPPQTHLTHPGTQKAPKKPADSESYGQVGLISETHPGSALIDQLHRAVPVLRTAPMLWRPSASAFIHGSDGTALTGATAARIYLPVADASLIPAAGAALVDLLWAAGLGRVEIGAAGQALMRTLVDGSVWQPERLDFAAAPILGPGLTRNPPAATVYGDPAGRFDLRRLIDAADGTVRTRAAAARKAALAAAAERLRDARAKWVDATAPDLAARSGLSVDSAKAVLQAASARHDLTGDFRLLCEDGSAPRVGDLLDNPAKWHGKRFADPLEPDYSDDRRIAWANLRSGGAPYLFSHAHGGRRFALVRPSRAIKLQTGERARVVDSLLDLLRERGELYDHGDGASLARVTDCARVLPVGRDWLSDHLDRVAAFYIEVRREKDGATTVTREPRDAPAWAAARLIAKDTERGLPRIDAVVTAPILRVDGSILSEPGYDASSRLVLVSLSPDLPAVPERPTMAQARAALDRLWRPVRLFPTVDDLDRGVLLAALLTSVLRAALPTAPGFAFDAPTAGTGKTLLAQALGALGTGTAPAALPPASNQDEEARKRLFAALRDGARVILWDNVREPLGNGAIDAFLTAPSFSDRILGKSETATLPNRALFLVTGNNLRLVGDTCRRVLPVRLDARIERPYARTFDFCPLATVTGDRLSLVADALTLVRAWIAAGRPRRGEGRTASFEIWDDLVRQPVCWVATWADLAEGFADPLDAVTKTFELDPETAKLAALLVAWREVLGANPPGTVINATAKRITVGRLVDHVTSGWADPYGNDDARALLRDALVEIAGDRAGVINRRILGRWIEGRAERRHNGLRLVRGTMHHGAPTWGLVSD